MRKPLVLAGACVDSIADRARLLWISSTGPKM